MKNAIDKIKQKFEEDPITMITVTAMAVGAVATIVNTVSVASNASTWRKEVNRRDRMTK